MFGFKISKDAKLSMLPFSTHEERQMFLQAVVTKMKAGGKAQLSPHEAFFQCAASVPDLSLHLVSPLGRGHHRDVAVTAAIQIMHIPGIGVAGVVVGFEQIDPALWSLRVQMSTPVGNKTPSLASMSAVSLEDDHTQCACAECRSNPALATSRLSEDDRSSTMESGDDLGYITPLAQQLVFELQEQRRLGLAPYRGALYEKRSNALYEERSKISLPLVKRSFDRNAGLPAHLQITAAPASSCSSGG
eukprot:FR742093.1.p1 GENE.FR742093.1~~FR742093.1.p1  ORF type:complete len:246 (+),score=17.57 FR742093.1:202-939(+)